MTKMVAQVQAFAKKETPQVLYLGTPSHDRDDIFHIQTKGFQNANCPIKRMDLSEIPNSRSKSSATGNDKIVYPTREEMRKSVDEADVIMVSGGNTLYAMNRWKQLGMDEILTRASVQTNDDDEYAGPVFCGGSAGAISWFQYGNSDSMNPMTFLNPPEDLSEEEKIDWDYIKIDGLNMVQALCVPHYDAMQHNGIVRSKASERMVIEDIESGYPCIGIDEEAAFVVDGDIVRVLEGKSGSRCYKKVYNTVTQALDVLVMEEGGEYSLSGLGL